MAHVSRSVVVTGTVVHLDEQVVIVPTEPPAPTRPPGSEELRRLFLAANPGWRPDDGAAVAAARRDGVADGLRSGSASVVVLHGTDLPPDLVRVTVRGELVGRSVDVDRWEPEPFSTSPWAEPRVEGVDRETAYAIADTVPTDWPLISSGVSTTPAGRSAVVLEVGHRTPEMSTWFRDQPPGSVQLHAFVDLDAGRWPTDR